MRVDPIGDDTVGVADAFDHQLRQGSTGAGHQALQGLGRRRWRALAPHGSHERVHRRGVRRPEGEQLDDGALLGRAQHLTAVADHQRPEHRDVHRSDSTSPSRRARARSCNPGATETQPDLRTVGSVRCGVDELAALHRRHRRRRWDRDRRPAPPLSTQPHQGGTHALHTTPVADPAGAGHRRDREPGDHRGRRRRRATGRGRRPNDRRPPERIDPDGHRSGRTEHHHHRGRRRPRRAAHHHHRRSHPRRPEHPARPTARRRPERVQRHRRPLPARVAHQPRQASASSATTSRSSR